MYVKPQASQIMARYKLYCLKQLTKSVDLWITQASELTTEAGFDSAIRDEMLRDHIVFATNFETVRTQCLEVGDELTLDHARHFALTYEHTQRQLKQMNEYTQSASHEVHSVRKRPPPRNKSRKNNTSNPSTSRAITVLTVEENDTQ